MVESDVDLSPPNFDLHPAFTGDVELFPLAVDLDLSSSSLLASEEVECWGCFLCSPNPCLDCAAKSGFQPLPDLFNETCAALGLDDLASWTRQGVVDDIPAPRIAEPLYASEIGVLLLQVPPPVIKYVRNAPSGNKAKGSHEMLLALVSKHVA